MTLPDYSRAGQRAPRSPAQFDPYQASDDYRATAKAEIDKAKGAVEKQNVWNYYLKSAKTQDDAMAIISLQEGLVAVGGNTTGTWTDDGLPTDEEYAQIKAGKLSEDDLIRDGDRGMKVPFDTGITATRTIVSDEEYDAETERLVEEDKGYRAARKEERELSQKVVPQEKSFVQRLREARTPDEIMALVNSDEGKTHGMLGDEDLTDDEGC